jgi:hypothetical protein
MPVRFHCTSCDQALSIGTRKVGRRIACPACHARVRVPWITEGRTVVIPDLDAAAAEQETELILDAPAPPPAPPPQVVVPTFPVRMGIMEEAVRPDRPPRLGILEGGIPKDPPLPSLSGADVSASTAPAPKPPAPSTRLAAWARRSPAAAAAGALALLLLVGGVALVLVRTLSQEPESADNGPIPAAPSRKSAERSVKNPARTGNGAADKKDAVPPENKNTALRPADERGDAFQFKIFTPPPIDAPKPAADKTDTLKLDLFKKADAPKDPATKPAGEKGDALKLDLFKKADAAKEPPGKAADKADALKLDLFKKPEAPREQTRRPDTSAHPRTVAVARPCPDLRAWLKPRDFSGDAIS